jgi:hypothetical protein
LLALWSAHRLTLERLTLTLTGARRPLTHRGPSRLRLPLRRRLVLLLLLGLRRERKSSHDRYQGNGDPRALESTHGTDFSTATRGGIMDQPGVEIYVDGRV